MKCLAAYTGYHMLSDKSNGVAHKQGEEIQQSLFVRLRQAGQGTGVYCTWGKTPKYTGGIFNISILSIFKYMGGDTSENFKIKVLGVT